MERRHDGQRAIRKVGNSRKKQSCCPISYSFTAKRQPGNMISHPGFQVNLLGVDAWTINPRVVQVAFSGFDEQDLEVVVQVCKPSSNHTSTRSCQPDTTRRRLEASTYPQEPPPQTIMSTSSGTVIVTLCKYECYVYSQAELKLGRVRVRQKRQSIFK